MHKAKPKDDIEMAGWESLGAAVVRQAIKDYEALLRKPSIHDPAWRGEKESIEKFFTSGDFNRFIMTKIPGEDFLKTITQNFRRSGKCLLKEYGSNASHNERHY